MASSTVPQPNAKTFTPEEIVSEVLAGRVRVPSFQRQFKWKWKDVKLLFDSIAKGYPIGNLLLWERQADAAKIQLGALEIDAPQGTALFVIDGQQRVTSLANVLTAEGSNDSRFSLAFNLENEEFEKPGANELHLLPLPVIFDLQQLLVWFAQRPSQKEWFERATRLAKTIRQYVIPAYVVKHQDEKVLQEIFDRLNNTGRRLSRAESFSGVHSGTLQDGSRFQFSDIAEAIDAETRFGRIDDNTVLKVILARRGIDLKRDVRAEFSENDQQSDFPGEGAAMAHKEGKLALLRAVRFVQIETTVPHLGFLPDRNLLVILARFFAFYPNPSQRNRILLRRFFWRVALAWLWPDGPHKLEIRELLARVRFGNEAAAVQRLLEASVWQPLLPSMDHFFVDSSDSRVVLCALWSLAPMSPVEGTVYDAEALGATLLNETNAAYVCKRFAPRAPEGLRQWAGNRAILLGEVDEVADDAAIAFLKYADRFDVGTHAKILKSHALDEDMLDLLKEQRIEAFLTTRQKRLEEVLWNFHENMTETKFEDTPPLDEFDLDEDARDDEVQH